MAFTGLYAYRPASVETSTSHDTSHTMTGYETKLEHDSHDVIIIILMKNFNWLFSRGQSAIFLPLAKRAVQ